MLDLLSPMGIHSSHGNLYFPWEFIFPMGIYFSHGNLFSPMGIPIGIFPMGISHGNLKFPWEQIFPWDFANSHGKTVNSHGNLHFPMGICVFPWEFKIPMFFKI